MITYRYSPYKPEDDRLWNFDRLMGILSEMIMRYDVEIDQALRMLIDQGLPVNMLLKEGGMEDLVRDFVEQLESQKNELLDQYHLKQASKEANRATRTSIKNIMDAITDPALRDDFKKVIDEHSVDVALKLKWKVYASKDARSLGLLLSRLITDFENRQLIELGQKKLPFRGRKPLNKDDAITLIKKLLDLNELIESLNSALRNGDVFNFSLEKLAKYLGPEAYQEFIERREDIFNNLSRVLENQGHIIRNEENGQYRLSPSSIRKIGSRVLEAIFQSLKAEGTGTHITTQVGDSENNFSETKNLEFGDSINHIDISSTVVNSLIRKGTPKIDFNDIEIFKSRGVAKNSTIILLDMSGSMMRADRFYNAKKVVLALDSLIREGYKEDKLTVVGFGTLAKVYPLSEIPLLQPFPVTIFDPHIQISINTERFGQKETVKLPLYFTNLQKGLSVARSLLGSSEIKNKQIILITDGVPTAHYEDQHLHINYPPTPSDFEYALKEVQACTENGIVINTFLLATDWEIGYFGEDSFIKQFARRSMGRIFYSSPTEMQQMILVDFIANRKSGFNID